VIYANAHHERKKFFKGLGRITPADAHGAQQQPQHARFTRVGVGAAQLET
jgi:hypothetical protein